MADLPPHIPGYAIVDSVDSDTPPSSLPPLPPSPPLPPITRSRRRAPSPPAPTLYLTGFSCVASDPEYQCAKKKTGDYQPYWFEEAYGAADFNEGVRRRARKDMTLLEDEIAIIDLNDTGKEMDKMTAKYQMERARERALLRQEPEWPLEGDEVSTDAAVGGSTNSSHNIHRMIREENRLEERRRTRGEEWKKLEEERERLRKEKKKLKAKEKEDKQKEKDERRASRVPMRDRALSLLDFQKKTKQKGKPEAEVTESQPEAAREDEKECHPSPIEGDLELPSPQTHYPATSRLTMRNPDLLEEISQLPSMPMHDRTPTFPPLRIPTIIDTDAQSGSTTRALRPNSISSTQVEVETEPQYIPENSGLVQGVGTLERQNPENSGLVQDFGTLERARSLRTSSGGLFRCCSGRRK